jgi:hypothetical protein
MKRAVKWQAFAESATLRVNAGRSYISRINCDRSPLSQMGESTSTGNDFRSRKGQEKGNVIREDLGPESSRVTY